MNMVEALTLNGDFRIGTAGDDYFVALPEVNGDGDLDNTLQSVDMLVGGEGYDTLFATLVGRGGAAIAPSLVDIENLSLRFVTDYDDLDLDLGSSSGIESVNVFNSNLNNDVDIDNVGDISSFSFENVEGDIDINDVTAANITVTGADSEGLYADFDHDSTLASFDSTTFTGDVQIDLETVTTDATISTGAGEDSVRLSAYDEFDNGVYTANATLESGTTISTGAGEDSVNIYSDAYSYTNNWGEDAVTNSTTALGNDVSIDTGDDDGYIGLGSYSNSSANDDHSDAVSTSSIEIGDNLNINAGSGNDIIDINAYAYAYSDEDDAEASSTINIGSNANISTGAGEDHVYISTYASANGEDTSTTTSSVTIGDNMTIDTGDGGGSIYISGEDAVSLGENTTINTGAGEDYVTIGTNGTLSLSIGAGSTFTTGDGDDSLSMHGEDIEGSDFAIDMGEGNDWINFHGDLGDNVTITTGVEAGRDYVGIYGDAGDGLNINTGKGSDYIQIDDVGADAVIKAGAGIDSINIFGDIDANAEIRMGAGNDNLYINGNVGDGSTIVLGADTDIAHLGSVGDNVAIDLGEGTDELLVIHGDAGNNVTITTGVEAGKDNVYIEGTAGDDLIINTGKGQDYISLNDVGADAVIRAGYGTDTVVINSSIDTNAEIHVGVGMDTVTGGMGANDIYVGNDTDMDTLVYLAQTDSAASSSLQDTVYGFNADDDMIDLTAVVEVDYLGEFDTKELLLEALTETAGEAGLVIGSNKLFVDVNGDAEFDVGNDMSIKLDGVVDLSSEDNFVVAV